MSVSLWMMLASDTNSSTAEYTMPANDREIVQVNVRLDSELVDRAKRFNTKFGHRMNWLISVALRQYLDRHEGKRRSV
jgi:uncharacterized protein (DUF4415 family)